MLQQGRQSGHPFGEPIPPEFVTDFNNASQPTLQMRLAHDWQNLNDAEFRSGNDETREVPVTKLGLERVVDFLRSGSNQEGERVAKA